MRTFISEKSRTNSPEVYTLGEEMKHTRHSKTLEHEARSSRQRTNALYLGPLSN